MLPSDTKYIIKVWGGYQTNEPLSQGEGTIEAVHLLMEELVPGSLCAWQDLNRWFSARGAKGEMMFTHSQWCITAEMVN